MVCLTCCTSQWRTMLCLLQYALVLNPLTVTRFSTARSRELFLCSLKNCVNVSIWMSWIFIYDFFRNKLLIVDCFPMLSLAVKYALSMPHRLWSQTVWETDTRFKGLNSILIAKEICTCEICRRKHEKILLQIVSR